MRSPFLHLLCFHLAASGFVLVMAGGFTFSPPAMTAGTAAWVLAIYAWERARGRFRG